MIAVPDHVRRRRLATRHVLVPDRRVDDLRDAIDTRFGVRFPSPNQRDLAA